jgi:hypothetical protein
MMRRTGCGLGKYSGIEGHVKVGGTYDAARPPAESEELH